MTAELSRTPRTPARALVGALLAFAVAMPISVAQAVPASAAGFDPSAAEQQMANLINQDRAQNGLGPLTFSARLSQVARGSDISMCGTTVHGRSQDMAERNYFNHQVPPCNQYVWSALSAAGISFNGAGENIGWNNYSPQTTSVDRANTSFMNSSGHRANILGNFNQVGIGAYMAPGPWNGGSGTQYAGVILYTEIFINGPTVDPPPPPPPPPTPQP
ncbi:MAG: hypothetical protein QOE92_2116, partial [Chloroflexota bacterium]|nr:hypothetical protein [Chloroflexota bacterium]